MLLSSFIGSDSFAGVEYDISNSFGAFIPKIGSGYLRKTILGVKSGQGSGKICGKYVLSSFQDVYGAD